MAETTTATGVQVFSKPEDSVGYLAILTALTTGILHLFLSPGAFEVAGFVGGALFILNGAGFLGGTVLYLSKYWRKELFLVAAIYALLTILAMFMVHGWGIEAFYRDDSLALAAVVTKAVESILIGCSLYLYPNS